MFKIFGSRGDNNEEEVINEHLPEHVQKFVGLMGDLDREVVRVQGEKGSVETDKKILEVRGRMNGLLGGLNRKKQKDIWHYWENEKVLRALEQERAAVQGTAATICNWPVGALKVTRSPIQQCANQTIRLISGTLVGAGWGLVQGVIDPFRKAA